MRKKSLVESARLIRWFVIVLLVVLVAAFFASRFALDLGPSIQVVRRDHGIGGALAAWMKDASALCFAVALIQLIRFLGRVGADRLFEPRVTGPFRAFAFWLMLSAIVAILGGPIASLLAPAGDGVRQIEFLIDLRDIMFLIAGLVLFLVARMLDEAARLDAELKEIV